MFGLSRAGSYLAFSPPPTEYLCRDRVNPSSMTRRLLVWSSTPDWFHPAEGMLEALPVAGWVADN